MGQLKMTEEQLLREKLGDRFWGYDYLKRKDGTTFQAIAYGKGYGENRKEGRGKTRNEALLDLIENTK